jgi:uncharacterized protein (DUF433 family)
MPPVANSSRYTMDPNYGLGEKRKHNLRRDRFQEPSLPAAVWQESAERARLFESTPVDGELRHFAVPLTEAFRTAAREYQTIATDPDVMGGTPCISGTRIPVYMVLDAIEYGGTLESAVTSYPSLSLQQIKDALGFAKLVVECPV